MTFNVSRTVWIFYIWEIVLVMCAFIFFRLDDFQRNWNHLFS